MSDKIAFVFDFDDTLVPDSTTLLLERYGANPDTFWKNARALMQDGWDLVNAFLKLLLDLTAPLMPLCGLTNQDLREFGATLKPHPGVPEFFDDIRKKVADIDPEIKVQFWVVSGGLEEIIRGCAVISDQLTGFGDAA